MKSRINGFWVILLIVSAFTLSSCEKKDECESVRCFNGGTCVEGSCDCTTADGYEGEFCQIEVNKKFAGFTMLMESCTNAQPRRVTVSINPSGVSPTRIRFDGLVNGFFQADGFIDGAAGKNFSIPRAGFGIEEIEGNGTISNDGGTITLTYRIYNPGAQTEKYSCMGTITK
jgi:hypothetical protein